MKSIKVLLMVLVGVVGFAVVSAQVAKADDIQIVCTSPTTCLAGGIQTTSSTSPTFDVNLSGNGNGSDDGEIYIAVLQPVTSGANFTSPASTTLWTALGLSGGSDHNFGASVGNDPYFTASDTGFLASDFNTGQAFTGTGAMTSSLITLPSAPYAQGTEFVAFTCAVGADTVPCTAGSPGEVVINSPFSESLEVSGVPVPTPEPGSLVLLGTGLLGLVGIGRRRFAKS